MVFIFQYHDKNTDCSICEYASWKWRTRISNMLFQRIERERIHFKRFISSCDNLCWVTEQKGVIKHMSILLNGSRIKKRVLKKHRWHGTRRENIIYWFSLTIDAVDRKPIFHSQTIVCDDDFSITGNKILVNSDTNGKIWFNLFYYITNIYIFHLFYW